MCVVTDCRAQVESTLVSQGKKGDFVVRESETSAGSVTLVANMQVTPPDPVACAESVTPSPHCVCSPLLGPQGKGGGVETDPGLAGPVRLPRHPGRTLVP